MEVHALLDALRVAERLKDTTRHCTTAKGRRESVAEHSWMLTLMAFFIKDEFPEADMDKVIRMGIIHDLGECFTGDIPVFEKTAAHEAEEERRLAAWLNTLPRNVAEEMRALYAEMSARETLEAKIYKAVDSLEAVIQHNISDISTWEPFEFDLQRHYAQNRVAFSEYMVALRKAIREETEEKIRAAGVENI